MKATALCTTFVLGVVAAFGGDARADHRMWRDLDDLTFDAMSHARDARWEVHDHFSMSRDYDNLLQDARRLYRGLRDIQDAIHAERDPHQIANLIEQAHDALAHFQEHVEHCDFAAVLRSTGTGYRNRTTRHAGYVHVQSVQSSLALVDDALHEIDRQLAVILGHDPHHGLEVVPDAQYRIQPAPGPVVVPPSAVIDPELSATSDVALPIARTRSGDAWLKLLMR
jgi:hypothetical protein